MPASQPRHTEKDRAPRLTPGQITIPGQTRTIIWMIPMDSAPVSEMDIHTVHTGPRMAGLHSPAPCLVAKAFPPDDHLGSKEKCQGIL